MAAKKLSILTELTLNAVGFNKGIDSAKEKFNALKEGTEKAHASIKGVFSNMGELFTPMTSQLGGLSTGIMSGVNSFKAMVPAITSVKAAFIATGIGAIVIGLATAFAALVSWMKRTDEGGDSMRKVFDMVKAVINTILDKLAKLGSAIVKLFKGDFKGAAEDAKAAFTGWGDSINDNIKKAKELNDIQDKLEDYNETAALKKAEIEVKISELARKTRDEESYSAQQRLTFVKQLREMYGELYRINKEGHDLELDELKKEQSTHANNQEIRQKINEKTAEGLRLTAEYNENITATSRLYNKTRNEIAAANEEQKKLAAEQLKAQKKKDMEGVTNKPISLRISDDLPKSDMVATLTARQNTYNQSLKNTNNLWREFGKEIKSNDVLLNGFSTAIDGITGSFTDLFSTGESSFKGFVTSILQGLQKIINGLLAQAIAGMIAGESKKGLLGLLTASIGLAALTGLWQAKVPKFESGGIVPGFSYTGDKIPIMANSGEMILNNSQQSNLFRMLSNGFGNSSGREVTFRIEGNTLVGVLNNYNRQQNRFR